MNNRLQNNIYECFSVQACENEWVTFSQGKLIVFSMKCLMYKTNKQTKKRTLNLNLLYFLLQFEFIWCTVQHCVSAAPLVFHHHLSVSPAKSESIVYWTQAYILCHSEGRNPKLWTTQKHTAEDEGWRLPSPTPSPLSSHSSDPPFFFFFFKRRCRWNALSQNVERQACWKKCFMNFKFTMSVCKILYALVWRLYFSVLCKDARR